MKARIITSVAIVTGMMACHTSKKSTDTPDAAATAAATSTSPVKARPANGIYEPGQEELAAIQAKFPETTLGQLKQGHMIYSLGSCAQCHRAKNIYQYNEAQWPGIMDDMAQRASLTEAQKDAVYKYVLAVKAVKANELK